MHEPIDFVALDALLARTREACRELAAAAEECRVLQEQSRVLQEQSRGLREW
jgi:hypothetical protein